MLLVGFTLVFLVVSVISQGWHAWATRSGIRVASIERIGAGKQGWLLIVESHADVAVGAVFDVYRRSRSVEAPLALFEVTEKTSTGAYQATPIGAINPSLAREHTAGSLRPADLVVREFVEVRRLRAIADELTREVADVVR
jgi:hypothetical protein